MVRAGPVGGAKGGAMTFEELERTYDDLRGQFESGELSQDAFHAAVKKLSLKDEQGRVWTIGSQSGQWYVWEGGAWAKAEPPQAAEPAGPTCLQCGAAVEAGSVFCGNCGQRLAVAGPQSQPATPPPMPAAGPQPQPATPPPMPPPPMADAARRSPAPKRRGVPVALLVGGALLVCLLVAAGGGYVWWRGRDGGPPATGGAGATQAPQSGAGLAPTETAFASSTPESGESDVATTTSEPVRSGSSALGDLQPLVGDWERLRGEGGLLRFRLQLEPDGRLRAVQHYLCLTEGEGEDRYYLELDADGEGGWTGDFISEYWDAWADETEEWDREPIVVELSGDGQEMTWFSPGDDEQMVHQRDSEGEENVTLRIVNGSDVDVWWLYVTAAGEARALDEEEDRLDSILWVDDACLMVLPPGVYNLTATDEDDVLVASRYELEVDRGVTWTITGGE